VRGRALECPGDERIDLVVGDGLETCEDAVADVVGFGGRRVFALALILGVGYQLSLALGPDCHVVPPDCPGYGPESLSSCSDCAWGIPDYMMRHFRHKVKNTSNIVYAATPGAGLVRAAGCLSPVV
jgi:hypothetical protein